MPDRPARRAASALLACAAGGAGAWIALHHPIAPGVALAGFGLWIVLAWRWPWLWLAVLPAAVPVANFLPWTGWIAIDEFDLLACGALAAGWGLRARGASFGVDTTPPPLPRGACRLAALLGALGLIGLARGWADAAPSAAGWFQGYADPLNSWRVFKSLLYALLLLPMLQGEIGTAPERAARAFAGGMLTGLTIATAASVWERLAYPGLWDFSVRYRTVALFWEMHVGGAAIDVYVALATPFVAWALWRARTPLQWAATAVLALLAAYAALTTFSRGVYLAVAGPLALLGLWLSGQRFGFDPRPWLLRFGAGLGAGVAVAAGLAIALDLGGAPGVGLALVAQCGLVLLLRRRVGGLAWRGGAGLALATALIVEGVVVLGPGSYMMTRMASTERDFGSRVAHWQRGLALLQGTADALWGIGLGRLPAHYAASGRRGEFPGSVTPVDADGGRAVRLAGPASAASLGGLFSLSQRVALQPLGAYRVALDGRVAQRTEVELSVCEMHLLYERRCQAARLRLEPLGGGWRHVEASLHGPLLDAGRAVAPRLGVFAVSVLGAGTAVELKSLGLRGPDGAELLRNRDFRAGLARWAPAAQFYFLPWHIDNLGLELLIERGALGALAFAALFAGALAAPFRAPAPATPAAAPAAAPIAAPAAASIAPFLAAAVLGALTVGLVSSVMDVPRVAFLLLLIAWFAILVTQRAPAADGPAAMISR